jgi:hypothetical protein
VDHNHTFGKQAAVARLGIPAQKPAVAKVVVALDQLHAVAAGQRELVGAPRLELVYTREVSLSLISLRRCRLGVTPRGGRHRQRHHLRTTTSTSPHRAASVCDRAAMGAIEEPRRGEGCGWRVVGGSRDNHGRRGWAFTPLCGRREWALDGDGRRRETWRPLEERPRRDRTRARYWSSTWGLGCRLRARGEVRAMRVRYRGVLLLDGRASTVRRVRR